LEAQSRPTHLPWLAPQLAALRAAQAAGRLPHALLIQETRGSGGLWLAQWYAQLVLCREPDAPCGHCLQCRRVLRNEHPDLRSISYYVDPKTDRVTNQIRVEQIRELTESLTLTSHGARGTLVVIYPAEAMNNNAANSLLKTLEEPRPGVFMVLVTSAAARLPATIRSRCQRLVLRAPARAEALAWLNALRPSPDWPAVLDVLGNAPLDALDFDPAAARSLRDETWGALRLAQRGRLDVPLTAERWAKLELPALLGCIENYLTSQVLARVAPAAQNSELRDAAHLPAGDLDINIAAVFGVLDGLRELRLLAATPINKALALESLLWRLAAGGAGGRSGTALNAG
jgi:DNA polymerase-3 subunit delta'